MEMMEVNFGDQHYHVHQFSFCNYPNGALAAASSHPLKCFTVTHLNTVNTITFLISDWIAEGSD